ncbi:MAG: RloB family protein [Dysgonamonadaceae bacterium]|jgi:hypothetical protein|nr:RloB family protein [Dysgonamonadaceae bacterium]
MARVRKIDNADLKRFAKSSKKNQPKEVKIFFLIVCEGEKTEPNYFRKFKGKFGNIIFEVDCEGKGYNTLQVVEEAIKIRNKNPNKYNRVWAVFDKDSFSDKDFNAAITKAKNGNIGCAWSNEAFELWYLLHFQYRNTSMSRNDYKREIEKEVNKKIANFRYTKNSTEMYDILQEYQEQAIANAEKLSNSYDNRKFAAHNPRTQVYELVKQLTGKDSILIEEIKKKFE